MPAIWRNVDRAVVASFAAIASVGFMTTGALADSDGSGGVPNFNMVWDASGDSTDPYTYNPAEYGSVEWGTWQLGGPAGDRTRTGWRYQGVLTGSDDQWRVDWDCVANSDPFVDATIVVTNTDIVTHTYTMFMPLAIVPIAPVTSMSGSVSSTLVGAPFVGGALAAGLSPVYQGYIDGGNVANLWNPGYVLATTDSDSDTTAFGSTPGPAALTTIAIKLEFTLTAGSSATVTGIFDIQAVPAPAGLALLGLAGITRGRRRR